MFTIDVIVQQQTFRKHQFFEMLKEFLDGLGELTRYTVIIILLLHGNVI